jgi:hypothetical protein
VVDEEGFDLVLDHQGHKLRRVSEEGQGDF